MIDGVLGTAGDRDLGKIGAVGARNFANLIGIAGQADQSRMKEWNVFGEMLGRITLGINRDEQRLHRFSPRAQLIERKTDRQEIGRTNIGTIGEAEIHQQYLAAEVGVGAALAGMIDQIEGPADRLLAPHHRVHELGGRTFAAVLRLRCRGCKQQPRHRAQDQKRPGREHQGRRRLLTPRTSRGCRWSTPGACPASAGARPG
jgi:hypothetical protein